jgi:hypothetical protein
MGHLGIMDQVLVTQVIPPQSSNAVVNGSAVDMQGWEGVAFVINLGAFTGAAVVDARVVGDDNSGFNSQTNITGAALTQVTSASPNNVAVIEVWRPTERYVRLVVTPATNTAAISASAIRYRRGGLTPPTQAVIEHIKVAQN